MLNCKKMTKENMAKLEITDINHAGEGVGRHNGRAVFVPYAAPGDIAVVRINEDKGTYLRAELLSLERESLLRVPPPCPVYLQCGGCQLQHLSYNAQLQYKRNRVKQALERIGKLKGITVRECLPAQDRFHYRNKARFSYEAYDSPEFLSGFYRRRTRDVVDFDECIIQSHTNNRIFQALKALIREYHIPIYDPDATHPLPGDGTRGSGSNHEPGSGSLRHLVTRTAGDGREALVVLVTHRGPLRQAQEVAQELTKRVPELAGVIEDVGGGVFGVSIAPNVPGPRLLLGKDRLTERISGLDFLVSAQSFLQVNPRATELLYGVILEYAQLTGHEYVIDAYSGIGTISLLLAGAARHVWGIESVKQATLDAEENARLNGIRNCGFITGKVEEVLGKREKLRADVVVLDPPRPGCEKGAIAGIAKLAPSRIIYVSCNPETLARDLARLERVGYQTVEVQPVDMFPQTSHIECVAIMRMKGSI